MEKTSLAEKSTIKKDASLPFYNPVMEGKKRAKKDSAYASGAWTKEEENRLSEAIKTFGTGDWMAVSNYVGTRNNKQCAQKWTQQMTPKTTGPWTAEEDYLLRQAVERCNTLEDSKVWSTICKSIPGRTNKQCRERWEEHLKPGINKGPWSPEEDALLLSLYSKLGTKWCKFIPSFKGRTQNFIKTRCILLLKGRKDGAADLPSSSQLKEKNSSLYQPNSTTYATLWPGHECRTSIKHSHHPPPTETNVSLEGSAARATSPLAETSPLEGATYPMTSANPFISSSSMKQQATENVGSVFENPGLGSTTRKRPNSFLSKSYAKNASQGSKTLVDLNAPLNNPFSTYGSCNEGSNPSDPSHVQGSLGLSSTPLSPSNASMINGFLPKNSYTSERRGMNDSPNSSINGSSRSVDNQVSYFTEPSFGGNDAKPPISNINFLNAESKSPSIHSLSEVPLSLQSIPSISSMANEVDDTSFLFFPHPAPSIDSEIMNVINNNNNNNYSGNTSFNPPAPSGASNNFSTFEMNNPLYNSFNIMSNTDMNDYSTSNGGNHGLFTETNYGQMEMGMPYSQQSNGNMNSDYLNAYDSYGPPESKRMNNSNQDLFQPLEGVHNDYMNEPNQSYYYRGYDYPGDSNSINGNTYNNAGVTNNMFFSDYPEEAQPIFTNQDFAIEKITHGNDVNEEDNLSDLDDFGIF